MTQLLLLTSSKLSPTNIINSLLPCLSTTFEAYSAAYIDVKSNMATSGWP